jgi:AcrR family transcriptional regulator
MSEGLRQNRSNARKRRAEVLATAAQVFYEKGYDATTTQDIADRLGILKGSLYYYIDTKEALLFEVIDDAYTGTLERLHAALESDDTPLERLRFLVSTHVIHLIDNLVRTALSLHEARALSPEHAEVLQSEQHEYRKGIASIIADGQKAGEIDPELDPRVAALSVLGAANWVYRWYRADGPLTPQQIADEITRFAIAGLRRH